MRIINSFLLFFVLVLICGCEFDAERQFEIMRWDLEMEGLKSRNPLERANTIRRLTGYSDIDQTYIEERLLKIIRNDSDITVRILAIDWIIYNPTLKPEFKEVPIEFSEDPDPYVRGEALTALGYDFPDRESLEIIVRHFDEQDENIKQSVACGLEGYGSFTADHSADITQELQNKAVPYLKILLADTIPLTRYCAANALSVLDPGVSEAIPVLIESLDSPSRLFSSYNGLQNYKRKLPEAVPELVRILKNIKNGPSIRSLIELQKPGEDFLDVLHTHGPESYFARYADEIGATSAEILETSNLTFLIFRIEGKPDLDWQIATDPFFTDDLRPYVVKTLGKVGTGPEAVAALEIACKDESSDLRAAAALALGDLLPEALEAESVVVALFEDENPLVRVDAATTMNKFDERNREITIPLLINTLSIDRSSDMESSLSSDVQWAKIHASKELGRIGASVIHQLLEISDLTDPEQLSDVTSIIQEIILSDPAAENVLKGLVNDESPTVKANAEKVLEDLEG